MILRRPLGWKTIPRVITIRHKRQASSAHASAYVFVGPDAISSIEQIIVPPALSRLLR